MWPELNCACVWQSQVSGADESSLYVEVTAISGDDVVCEAKNSAVLAGLLTLVHSRAGASTPVDMPLLAPADRAAFKCATLACTHAPPLGLGLPCHGLLVHQEHRRLAAALRTSTK